MANKSNTMELDSILQEARTRKQKPSSQSASSHPNAPRQAASRAAAPRPAARRGGDEYVALDSYSGAQRPKTRPAASAQPQKKKKKTGLIVTLCIVAIVLVAAIAGVTYYMLSGNGTGPQSTFSDNVYVNGKSLKDMTMEDARAAMKPVEEELANGIKIDVKAGDKTFNYTKNDFKYSFDTEAVLKEAKEYSESKGIKTEDKNYEIKMTLEDSTCDAIVTGVADKVKSDAKDATVTEFDPSADSMFTIAKETKGTTLDQTAGLKALKSFIGEGKVSGTVEMPVKEVDPKYTQAFLKDNITKLSSFSTVSTNNSNGNENMRLSLSMCNGSIIEPGATWSFNEHTGNSNLESNGFKPAGVIVNGKSETGVGGGICQSSTTIYNACILCGMTVEERQCHYYKSVYVDAGRDATVDYGNIDLKVSNPFGYQLFMKCWMDGTELNCEIYGLENPEFDDIEISTTSPSYFDRGYKVYTTRTYLKDGKEVKTDDLPSSTYYTSAPSSGSSGSGSSDSGSSDDSDSSGSESSSGSDSGEGGAGSGSDESGGDSAPAAEGGGDSAPAAEGGGDSAPAAEGGNSGDE